MSVPTFKICCLCRSNVKEDVWEKHELQCRNGTIACRNKCGETIPRYMLEYHLEFECKGGNVSCRFCAESLNLEEVEIHEEKCAREVVECTNECHSKIPRCNLSQHLAKYCSKRIVVCYYCNSKVVHHDMEVHEESCDLRLQRCHKCGVKIQNVFMTLHENANCETRLVRCNFCNCSMVSSSLSQHLEQCDFMHIFCENNCGIKMQRKDMKMHVDEKCHRRIVQCEYCEDKIEEESLREHQSKCSKVPIACPKTCGASVVRENVEKHLDEECVKLYSQCPYISFMCTFEGAPVDLRRHMHEESIAHMDMMKNVIDKFMCDVDNQMKIVNQQIGDLQCNMDKVHTTIHTSYTHSVSKQSEMQKEVESVKNEMHSNTVVLGKQNEIIQEIQKTMKNINEENIVNKITKLEGNKALTLLESRLKIMSNKVDEMTNEQSSYIWRITGFRQKLVNARLGLNTELHSPPFCSSKYGYKFELVLYPNGDVDCEGYLSVFMSCEIGYYDSILEWPFKKWVEFELVDQKSQGKNIAQCIEVKFENPNLWVNVMQGLEEFVSHKTLQSGNYIVDDVILLKVSIK